MKCESQAPEKYDCKEKGLSDVSCEIDILGKGVSLRIHAPVPVKEQRSVRL